MPIAFHHRLRVARRMAWYVLALALVCTAVVVGAASQLLPLAERHPDRVASWLSQRAGRPVSFSALKTQWTRRGPLLQLDGLRIGAGQGLQIGQAEILVSMYSGLFPGHAFTELRLRNIALEAERAADGRWTIRGFPGQRSGGDPLNMLEGLGELQVIGGRLHVLAPSLGWDLQLPRIDLRLRVEHRQVNLGVRLDNRRAGGEPIKLAAEFDRHSGNGRAYLEGDSIALADWPVLSGLAGMQLRGGSGDVHAWAQMKAYRPTQFQTDLDLKQVQLATRDGSGEAEFAELRGRAQFRTQADGWRLDIPELRLGPQGTVQGVDGLALVGGATSQLVAERIDAGPLLGALAMSDSMSPNLRSWLQQAKPYATLTKLQASGRVQGPLRLAAQVQHVGFAPVGQAPGLSGLAGTLSGDEQGIALALDQSMPLRFDWPAGFGVVHTASLRGTLVAWREGAGWKVGTPSLVVDGPDFGLDVRGDVWFQNDSTRPWLNIAADLHDTPIPAARGFWVRNKMSQSALQWLNMAMQGGTLKRGTGLVAGDLDDWPFLNNQGLFDAGGDIEDGRIKFQADWPEIQRFDGHVRFVNNGFTVDGKGQLDEVPISHIEAGIADWHDSVLKVDAAGGSDTAGLLSLVRHSPLDKAYGSSIKGLSATGPGKVDYTMQLPLHSGSPVERKIGGHVTLEGAHLTDSTWDLDFKDARGVATFDDGGFDAPSLAVTSGGQAGVLALRAGKSAQQPGNVFEAQLQSPLTTDELLQRVPEISWLQPYLRGRSRWTIGVGVSAPRQPGESPPVQITAQSDLVGTSLDLPAPLDKPAQATQPIAVTVQLPLGTGRVDVNFGTLMALRAQPRANATGVQVDLGQSSVTEPVPASGLSVGGTASELDAAGWIAVARALSQPSASTKSVANDTASSPASNSKPAPNSVAVAATATSQPLKLRGIDITAQSLLLIGSTFPATRVQVKPAPGALDAHLDGNALSGNVNVPDDENAPVRGQLARLYWAAAPAANASPSDGSTSPLNEEIDPAVLPPLALDIADLRVGQAKLGATALRTHKVPAGLRIDRLQMHSAKQKIDINGEWIGHGNSAHTHLLTSVDSQNLGELMDGLGMNGRVRNGSGKLSLDLAWPSSPSGFSLAGLEGSAKFNVSNGALLEVEPGAGRLLGLFSLTQLPRRLMLDFSDFFSKGFTFNRVEGDVAFTDGHAKTNNTVIEGPAAEIRIGGTTDLKGETFDQTIHVLPRSGNLLAIVGAVAGGPVGAAMGAAANAVLHKPLGEIGAKTYHVTGPWKSPKVEVSEHQDDAVNSHPAHSSTDSSAVPTSTP